MNKVQNLDYRMGDNLDFYLQNRKQAIWSIVMDNIRDDFGKRMNNEECEAELRRLCEPCVRHYADCNCAICR
jgi:hypothetical protein